MSGTSGMITRHGILISIGVLGSDKEQTFASIIYSFVRKNWFDVAFSDI
jgi:hypothetical protein